VSRRRVGLATFVLTTSFGAGSLLASEALAERPGGGSYFGGSSSKSSSSSGSSSFGGGSSFDDDDDDDHRSSFGSSSSSRDNRSPFGSSSPSRDDHSASSSGSGYGSRDDGKDIGPIGFGFILLTGVGALYGVRWLMHLPHSRDSWSSAPEASSSDPIDYDTAFRALRPSPAPFPSPLPSPPRPERVFLESLRGADANFSQILLEDFLYELYVRAQQARGTEHGLALLAPYLDPSVRSALATRGQRRPLSVDGVIVGAMRVAKLELRDSAAAIDVEYETNYTETFPGEDGPKPLGFYAKERWTFVRSIVVQSPKPDQTRSFGCPSCGAPVEHDQADACRHCGTLHGTAEHDWLCRDVALLCEETRGPALGGYAMEVGTYDRTVQAFDLAEAKAALQQHDPGFDLDRFLARVDLVYHQLNAAWSSLDWNQARPYLSDRLWLSMRYWIHAYEEQTLWNQMREAKVTRKELAKVLLDPFFHAITVRVWASAKDVTIHRQSGALVGGDPQVPREYSEYWTFIRSAERRGASSSTADTQCPSCSAPLSINMAGSCESCGVKLTAGQFDWVLSKIEQDEAYAG
jgi:hypothetical protein